MRIGFGYDVHPLAKGEKFWLGGIQIEHSKGCIAYSDGDVLVHAICDALLGAACLRDIGFHFPDSSEELKDIDSKILLKKTVKLLKKHSYKIGNIDATICLQQPKIEGLIPAMQQTLAKVMGIYAEDISIKATTTEKLGFVGEEKGVSASAVVLIRQKKRTTLVLGASENEKRYSNVLINRLLNKPFHKIFAVGKQKGRIQRIKVRTKPPCSKKIETVAIYLAPKNQKPYYEYLQNLMPDRILFPPGTENPELQALLQKKGISFENACPLVMLSTGKY